MGSKRGVVRRTHRKWIWWIFPPRLGDLDQWSCWLKVAIPWRDVDEKVFKKGVNAGFILLYLPAGRILFWSLPMRCIYDVASYRTHIHILLTTTTTIIIITTVITVITFITIITSTLSITIIMFTCFIVFLIYNIIRTIIQRCLSVSLWSLNTSSSSKVVFVLPKHRDGKKNLDTPKASLKTPIVLHKSPQVRWPSPFIEVAWVTCAARFHRIARLWTSNEDQEAAVMAQSVVEVIRFLGGFLRDLVPVGWPGLKELMTWKVDESWRILCFFIVLAQVFFSEFAERSNSCWCCEPGNVGGDSENTNVRWNLEIWIVWNPQ